MAVFTYTARTKAGEKINGTLEAVDRRGALLVIERMGHIPVLVEEKSAEKVKGTPVKRWGVTWHRERRLKMNRRDMLMFTSELSDLLSSGMKLGNALNTLARRETGTDTDAIVVSLRDDIIQGSSLSDALAKYRETFPQLYVSLIKAGEASGALSPILQRLVEHYERMQEVKSKVTTAMIYPAFLLVAGVMTIIFAMTFVIPRFAIIFNDLNITLPLPTRMLIGASEFSTRYGWIVVIAVVVGVTLFRRYISTAAGRFWWHGLHLRLPLIRDVVMANSLTQFASTLGMLIGNGVSVLDSLGISEKIIQNTVLAAEIRNAKERVTDGTSICGPLAASKVFPRMLTDMLAIGEETGDMSGALEHITRRYETSLDQSFKVFTIMLEPILIVVMFVVVGFVAVSMLLAVFEVTSGLNI